jgi:hypothetical protein
VPQLVLVPFPQTIAMCNLLGWNVYVPPFMANFNTLEALVHTWSPRFVSFLDEEQWEPYDGPRYMANKVMRWKKRGPRRCAWYAMEIDRVKSGRSKSLKVNSEYVEDRHEIRCSKCHKTSHN